MGNITTKRKRSDWSSLPADMLWIIKDKLEVVIFDRLLQMGNITTKRKRSDWSSLPADMLWIIKDKLEVVIFDRLLQMGNITTKRKRSDWSSLPADMLWIIKDKLEVVIFDRLLQMGNITTKRKRSDWSSLPADMLWIIKDKLEVVIFDRLLQMGNITTKRKRSDWSSLPADMLWIIKDKLEVVIFDRLLQMGNITTKRKRSDWSSLPADMLWIIKDKLEVVDAMRVDMVCKSWKSASERYRRPTSKIVLFHRGDSTLCQCIVNVLTKEQFALDLCAFGEDTELMFSKKGWLLLINPRKGLNIVLVHPESDAKITMPEFLGEDVRGCFSLDDNDCPHLVVLATQCDERLTFFVAPVHVVGEWTWTAHSMRNTIGRFSLLLVGTTIYCLGDAPYSRLVIFNISNLMWRVVPAGNLANQSWMMESEGELMMIEESSDRKELSLFKLSAFQSTFRWERLPKEDFKCRSWFIGSRNNFVVKESDKDAMIYLRHTDGFHPYVRTYIRITDCTKEFERSADFRAYAEWVDLGLFHKLPKSTVRHYPAGLKYADYHFQKMSDIILKKKNLLF
ncbi:F-box/kelch-repeat protein [Thalictrum thalictroides]|uniref:F-box/kelch-repeat protein n=1 Tax=Thalictrum thalictroides TaxID=46969 RepID=A0A7J6VGS0_THATH|nr:F-box/kelch-repeat protein [Thalictrum thalictroides]